MAARYKWPEAPEAKTYLQEWRETQFATQQELANVIGLPAPTISRYETGEREWGKGYLEALAHAVGCKVPDLFSPPQAVSSEAIVDTSSLMDAISVIEDAIDAGRMKPKTAADKAELIALLYAQRVSGNTSPSEQKPDNETGGRGDDERQRKRSAPI